MFRDGSQATSIIFQMLFSVGWKRSCPIVRVLICSSVWLWCFQLPVRADQDAALAWDASSDPEVAGYRIYYGTQSQDYTNCIDVGNVTNATITGLAAGTTYYFAATTYYASGDESDYSNETIFTVPAAALPPPAPSLIATNLATLTSMSRSDGHFSFTISGTAGSVYIVEASADLVNWVAVQTNAAPFVFTETNSDLPKQFYRAVRDMVTVSAL